MAYRTRHAVFVHGRVRGPSLPELGALPIPVAVGFRNSSAFPFSFSESARRVLGKLPGDFARRTITTGS